MLCCATSYFCCPAIDCESSPDMVLCPQMIEGHQIILLQEPPNSTTFIETKPIVMIS
jgi:hypothetical protein